MKTVLVFCRRSPAAAIKADEGRYNMETHVKYRRIVRLVSSIPRGRFLEGGFCLEFVGSPAPGEDDHTGHQRRDAQDSRHRIHFAF